MVSSLPVVRRPGHLAGRRAARATSGPTTSPTRCAGTTRATWSAGSAGARRARAARAAPRLSTDPVSLALPVPGRPGRAWAVRRRSTSPRSTRDEAVVAGAVGLVPEVDARTVVWRAYPADRVPWVDERETAIELRTTLADVTATPGRPRRGLVAAGHPRPADEPASPARRSRSLPGTTPAGSRPSSEPCCAWTSSTLARAGDGGAVSAYEMEQRRAALGDLDRAARRALVGACSGRSG